jgi:hypothetical protein
MNKAVLFTVLGFALLNQVQADWRLRSPFLKKQNDTPITPAPSKHYIDQKLTLRHRKTGAGIKRSHIGTNRDLDDVKKKLGIPKRHQNRPKLGA